MQAKVVTTDTSNESGTETQPESSGALRPGAAGPRRLSKGVIAFSLTLGVLAGVGVFTFGYGKGASYLSNNPQSCINCHVMQDQMDSWQHSSHHHVAVCNDCHLPHDLIGKWVTKADNGFFHSLAFTMGGYKDPIQIKPRNRRVTESACLSCHSEFVHNLLPNNRTAGMRSCIHCHGDVGHGAR
ncbi:MAG: cytochrome c nitrite reductase small subunit [Fuerstiella sp.]